jgi:hypothetical protein
LLLIDVVYSATILVKKLLWGRGHPVISGMALLFKGAGNAKNCPSPE